MKLYYKLTIPAFYTLFMVIVECVIVSIAVEKFMNNDAGALLLLIFIAFLGFVTFCYGKMVWMRLCRIPVLELSDRELRVRGVIKEGVRIPYKYIESIRFNDRGIVVLYRTKSKKKAKSVNYNFLDVSEEKFEALVAELRNDKKVQLITEFGD